MSSKNFALAVDSFNIHLHQTRPAITLMTLWSGIESLFPVHTELRFRLSLYIAAFLEDDANERHHLFRKVQRLYDGRSKVVHGGDLSQTALVHMVDEVGTLLGQILLASVEYGSVPSRDQFDGALFRFES